MEFLNSYSTFGTTGLVVLMLVLVVYFGYILRKDDKRNEHS